jgi:nucleoside-diphosphate-sugar epimerase
MKQVLITGATGFVGKEMRHQLRIQGIPCVEAVRYKINPDQFEMGNLNEKTNWTTALSGCDVVVHLAARVHMMQDKVGDPLGAYREVNVDATMALAEQSASLGIRRFIFVSSVKVNGEATTDKAFTAHDVPAPLDPYGQSKMEAEYALQKLGQKTGMEIVIVRPPLVYGPGVRANFLRLMQLVRLGIPLPLGNIHNCRSMVALDNLVNLLMVCIEHPNAAGQILMVSDDEDMSTSALIKVLAQAMNKKIILLPIPSTLIRVGSRLIGKVNAADRLLGSLQVDIRHTKKTLNWTPAISSVVGIQKTVSHFLNQI